MKHPDPLRFSDLLAGELDPSEIQNLEKHLEVCDDCAALLRDLRNIHRLAGELPDRLPTRDLWPGIVRAIDSREGGDPDVIRLHPGVSVPGRKTRRGFHLSFPQAAAAGLALALFSGVIGARLGRGPGSQLDIPQEAASVEVRSPWVRLVREATPGLEARAVEVARLEQTLAEYRGELDPLTAQVLEKNLGVIDNAIRESASALREDPGNRFLENNLERAILAKGDYLRGAALLVAPIS